MINVSTAKFPGQMTPINGEYVDLAMDSENNLLPRSRDSNASQSYKEIVQLLGSNRSAANNSGSKHIKENALMMASLLNAKKADELQ